MASVHLSPDERVLAKATRRAVQEAGGLEDAARELSIGKSQLARCCSVHDRDSISERDAHILDGLAGNVEGAPFLLNARARLLDCIVIRQDLGADDEAGLMRSIAEMAAELGDLSRAVTDALRDGTLEDHEIDAALAEVEQLDRCSATLRRKLDRMRGAKQ